jgi:hypothetical protein
LKRLLWRASVASVLALGSVDKRLLNALLKQTSLLLLLLNSLTRLERLLAKTTELRCSTKASLTICHRSL